MQNYFNYFTEIEERFQRRRGSLLLLSTLDWALIETWREAGVPLEAVLQGIDSAFDRHDARRRKGRLRRINGLAYCAQEVIAAVEDRKEAATGAAPEGPRPIDEGFEEQRLAAYLEGCARGLEDAPMAKSFATLSARLRELAKAILLSKPDIEQLEIQLTAMEEKLFAILMAATPEEDLVALRQQAASEIAPFRSRMQGAQIRQVEQQFQRKRLLEKHSLPRLSLFYMSQA